MKLFLKLSKFAETLGASYEITQEDDVITLKVQDTSSKEKRKAEFESLVKEIDDDLFINTMNKIDKLGLSDKYENHPEQVYSDFFKAATEVLNDKIKSLNQLTTKFDKFLTKK